jgi:uncharacterized lipoprotein NlpE involved in copper resistance
VPDEMAKASSTSMKKSIFSAVSMMLILFGCNRKNLLDTSTEELKSHTDSTKNTYKISTTNCDDPSLSVKTIYSTEQDGSLYLYRTGEFLIECKSISPTVFLAPCNLPSGVDYKDGMKVKFTGKRLTYPGEELTNVY